MNLSPLFSAPGRVRRVNFWKQDENSITVKIDLHSDRDQSLLANNRSPLDAAPPSDQPSTGPEIMV